MAPPVTARFGKFQVKLGSGSAPIVYAAPCGFTSKSLNLNKSLSEVAIPDCDDPDKPITMGRDVESTSASIEGEGVLAAAAVTTWLDAYESTESVPVQVEIEFSTGTVTWTGYMHIETLELGAEQGGRVTINVTMQSDGELVRSATF
jgi:predicted secreted protein